MIVSPLSSDTLASPNRSSRNGRAVDTITIHCTAGQGSARSIASLFLKESRKASCNYAVGREGDIACSVPEEFRSWCSSSRDNDERAVTIEVSSDSTDPYAVTDRAYQATIELVAEILRRRGYRRLVWLPTLAEYQAYVRKPQEALMSVHRWFADKACPGQYLLDRMPDIAREVNSRLMGRDEALAEIKEHLARIDTLIRCL